MPLAMVPRAVLHSRLRAALEEILGDDHALAVWAAVALLELRRWRRGRKSGLGAALGGRRALAVTFRAGARRPRALALGACEFRLRALALAGRADAGGLGACTLRFRALALARGADTLGFGAGARRRRWRRCDFLSQYESCGANKRHHSKLLHTILLFLFFTATHNGSFRVILYQTSPPTATTAFF